jgi:hypothetical protein
VRPALTWPRSHTSPLPPGGGVPKPNADAKAAIQGLVPKHPAVGIRPMFGDLAGFATGNMFTASRSSSEG